MQDARDGFNVKFVNHFLTYLFTSSLTDVLTVVLSMVLPYGENFIILTSTVFDWPIRVTDRRTDGQTADSIQRAKHICYMLSCTKNYSHTETIIEIIIQLHIESKLELFHNPNQTWNYNQSHVTNLNWNILVPAIGQKVPVVYFIHY